jgi:hypothetical protein
MFLTAYLCTLGCSPSYDRKWRELTETVIVSTTLQPDDNPGQSYSVASRLYLHKWREGPNETTGIADPGMGFGRNAPVISNLYDGSHWTTWTDWYTVAMFGTGDNAYPAAYYWDRDTPFPQLCQCGNWPDFTTPYYEVAIESTYVDDEGRRYVTITTRWYGTSRSSGERIVDGSWFTDHG